MKPINIKDRLPDPGVRVLVWVGRWVFATRGPRHYESNAIFRWDVEGDVGERDSITYWMPEPPEE